LIIPAALAVAPVAGQAQTAMDVASLTVLDEVDLVDRDGAEIGDVEEGLIGPDGSLVAVVVEVGGFLEIGDEDRVIAVERLSFEDGDFVTDLTTEEIETMPEWDD
jgi:hypothetical protein